MDKQEFITTLWGALKPATDDGFNARALLAQIALETGWLDHINKFQSSFSTFNLFNITAGPGWQGIVCHVPTHEVVHGKRVPMTRPFRAYSSYEDSIKDYMALITGAHRYILAYSHRGDMERYLKELGAAAYSTNPQYAMQVILVARDLPRLPDEEVL
jgi:flagellar protein FlgJ